MQKKKKKKKKNGWVKKKNLFTDILATIHSGNNYALLLSVDSRDLDCVLLIPETFIESQSLVELNEPVRQELLEPPSDTSETNHAFKFSSLSAPTKI